MIESIFDGLPSDAFVSSVKVYPYNSTDYATILMTNYGILIKSSIDYSFLTLGVDDPEINSSVILYPNPSRDYVSFSDNTISNIEIYNMQGKMVKESKSNTISVRTLSNGLYVVKGVKTTGGEIVKKLIKN